ncbi:MAG: hypothetical protein LBB14_00635, partial [Puniceicoccales bacterium]|nr:hypothetical protein [Puniceicoccales bacterium]
FHFTPPCGGWGGRPVGCRGDVGCEFALPGWPFVNRDTMPTVAPRMVMDLDPIDGAPLLGTQTFARADVDRRDADLHPLRQPNG